MATERKWNGMNWARKDKRLAIVLRDGGCCVYCGATVVDGATLTLDHITCWSHGGSNDPDNLVTACRTCNSSRNNRTLVEFTDAVASYKDNGLTGADIRSHIRVLTGRNLASYRKQAKALLAESSTWAEALVNATK
jgi:hypothetical protein